MIVVLFLSCVLRSERCFGTACFVLSRWVRVYKMPPLVFLLLDFKAHFRRHVSSPFFFFFFSVFSSGRLTLFLLRAVAGKMLGALVPPKRHAV